jgi:mannose-1-phosphate guanylyltransferase
MAGGAGERFWPYSRRNQPKQLLPLVSDQSMLAETVQRVSPIIPVDRIFIVAGAHLKDSIQNALPELPSENLLIEPMPRNTAPCLALAAAVSFKQFGEVSMAVLTADHYIQGDQNFLNNVEAALTFAENNPALVTFGIPPKRPDTGYGYIEAGEVAEKSELGVVCKVTRFHEKPDQETAKKYVKQGNFFWNSGMFFWRNTTFLETAREKSPELADAMEKIKSDWGTSQQNKTLKRTFESLQKTSIDYALMEKSENVFVVEADFGWDDIGTWQALDRIVKIDNDGNVCVGNGLAEDTQNTIIFNKATGRTQDRDPLVVTLGVNDLVIVNTGDAILICPKDRCQDIKEIIKLLQDKNLYEYL